MSYDLTGQKISFTYGRVVQVVSGSYYDGFGNLLALGSGSMIITASFDSGSLATTGSNTFSGSEIISGSLIVTNGITGSLNTDYIDFNTSSIVSSQVGRVTWNNVDGTLDVGLKGGNVVLQVGQEELCRVVNKETIDLLESNYQVVKIISAQGQRLAVNLAKADSDTNHLTTLGIVAETILKNEEGFVTVNGLVREIDTTGTLQGETWQDGDLLFLSPNVAGGLTKIKPTAPNHTIRMAYVVYAHPIHGKLYVKVDIGYEIGELHDIIDTTTTSSYGDLLIRSGSVWTNSKNLTGSYILSGSLTSNNGITSSIFGTSSWANNSITSSHALTASYALNGNISSSGLTTGSTYPITSSWSENSLTASSCVSASYAPTNNNITASYAIFINVSSSLNFTDDAAAAAGGVPLGGLYRNGNFILIRLT